jgi:formylglycine-generating enzyme required for sulfatase activity
VIWVVVDPLDADLHVPAGVNVTRNGALFELKIDDGDTREIDVEATKAGYETERQTIQVAADNTGRRVIRLQPISETLSAPHSPPAAQSPPGPPLRLKPIGPQTVNKGSSITVPIEVTDPARWTGKIRYALDSATLSGATVDAASGTFTCVPAADVRPIDYQVTVSVAGPHGNADTQTFAVKVRPETLSEESLVLVPGVTIKMVYLPGESSQSGRSIGDSELASGREAAIRPFYLGKFEVTQQQWQLVMEDNPSYFKKSVDSASWRNYPVESVSWNKCQEFLSKVNERNKTRPGKFRLPTEAEWEHACRVRFPGDDVLQVAWVNENSDATTHPVGQKAANDWNLHDMFGNVSEWCQNGFEKEEVFYGGTGSRSRPGGLLRPSRRNIIERAVRGGSFMTLALDVNRQYRSELPPNHRNNRIGFRLALSYDSDEGP